MSEVKEENALIKSGKLAIKLGEIQIEMGELEIKQVDGKLSKEDEEREIYLYGKMMLVYREIKELEKKGIEIIWMQKN